MIPTLLSYSPCRPGGAHLHGFLEAGVGKSCIKQSFQTELAPQGPKIMPILCKR